MSKSLNMHTLITNLGIEFQNNTKEITATMPVDERTIQPYGFLSGGASLALAETLAGYASRLHCPHNKYPLGIQVSANHIASLAFDPTQNQQVMAKARSIHLGLKTHIWDIEITDETGKIISSARITNMILTKR